MITKIYTADLIGIDPLLTTIETDLSQKNMRASFALSGFGDGNSSMGRNRIIHALINSGFNIPDQKIVINITPHSIKKGTSSFDLPIALAILNTLGIIEIDRKLLESSIFCGELSLDGSLIGIRGALAIALGSQALSKTNLFIPYTNASECSRVENIDIYPVHTLKQLVTHLTDYRAIKKIPFVDIKSQQPIHTIDFQDVYGQDSVKRALQIAVAGFHNVLMVGSPGSGKTMLAERTKTITTPLSNKEILETNKIYSIAGSLKNNNFMYERPYRSPHHTVSRVGLVGGGPTGQPGEISLAHNGILFLDELTEFPSKTLEVLRQPLEQKTINIVRAGYSIELPANFILIGACNPCPCGNFGDKKNKCTCNAQMRDNYFKKLSGPFLDRIDLQVAVQSVDFKDLTEKRAGKSSKEISREVAHATEVQLERNGGVYNGNLNNQQIKNFCAISEMGEKILEFAFKKLGISARSYHKILKVARTIADLSGSKNIEDIHLKESLMFRSFDKE